MREIKFRVWDREQNVMHYFYTMKICDNGVFFEASKFNLVSRHNDDGEDDQPIMQFTGLKDKNGKEIYEGDIVVNKFIYIKGERPCVIEWYQPWACFITKSMIDDYMDSAELRGDWLKLKEEEVEELNEKENRSSFCYETNSRSIGKIYRQTDTYYDIEIIGNIYENPKLIE